MTSPAPAPARVIPFRGGSLDDGMAVVRIAEPAISFPGPHVLAADISEFQPDLADAAYLAWSKAIVIRCAYGASHDDGAWYGGQRRAMLHAGGARFLGIYQYLTSFEDGAAQARAFRSVTGALQPGEVAIADFEEGTHAVLTAWYDEMLALGYNARYLWTYTGLNFGTAQHALPVQWIAAYQAGEPSSPHDLWQFTDAFTVPGAGTADCSVFHGTIDQLAALAVPVPQPLSPPRHQMAVVRSWTTSGTVSVTSSDGGWSWDSGAAVPAGVPVVQAGEITTSTGVKAWVVTVNGGKTWRYAGTPKAGA